MIATQLTTAPTQLHFQAFGTIYMNDLCSSAINWSASLRPFVDDLRTSLRLFIEDLYLLDHLLMICIPRPLINDLHPLDHYFIDDLHLLDYLLMICIP